MTLRLNLASPSPQKNDHTSRDSGMIVVWEWVAGGPTKCLPASSKWSHNVIGVISPLHMELQPHVMYNLYNW